MDGVRFTADTDILLHCVCRFYRLCMLRHSGSDWPCYFSFAHYHRWGRIFIQWYIIYTYNEQFCQVLVCIAFSFPTILCRRLSAFGCVLSASCSCSRALLCVSGGLWLLWRRTGWEWKTPLDGASQIWLCRYGLMIHLEKGNNCMLLYNTSCLSFCIFI